MFHHTRNHQVSLMKFRANFVPHMFVAAHVIRTDILNFNALKYLVVQSFYCYTAKHLICQSWHISMKKAYYV